MTNTFSATAGNQILATDLDGTLIPLAGSQQNQADLEILKQGLQESEVSLVFVTGRHFASVQQAIAAFQLPLPDWIICDVGTSIFQRHGSGEFQPVGAYGEHLQQIISSLPTNSLRERLEPLAGLRLQEREKQGRFKLSFYADAPELERLVDQVQTQLDENRAPYSIIHSIDPFNGDGLIDLLPAQASKAYALEWWANHTQRSPESIVFAGDSGNDLAALTAGHRAIVVANADQSVIQQACDGHREAGWKDRLCIARGSATSGVLEGCRWFELIGPQSESL